MLKYSCKGSVIWITGLSDSGKTTLAKLLVEKLKKNNYSVISLDGDELRAVFGTSKKHDRQARLDLASKYSSLCKMLALQDHTVVIATISMFKEIHAWNRSNIPGYFEVYLKTPIEEVRRRDTKGLYKRYDLGELKNVYGLDLKADEPQNPECLIEYNPQVTPEDNANLLFESIVNNNLVKSISC